MLNQRSSEGNARRAVSERGDVARAEGQQNVAGLALLQVAGLLQVSPSSSPGPTLSLERSSAFARVPASA